VLLLEAEACRHAACRPRPTPRRVGVNPADASSSRQGLTSRVGLCNII
jgi:hypothetical protein